MRDRFDLSAPEASEEDLTTRSAPKEELEMCWEQLEDTQEIMRLPDSF